ncbi:MAG: pyridoxamine 5'-phosphate oxidase family protein [Acidobacteriaceae bacterium]
MSDKERETTEPTVNRPGTDVDIESATEKVWSLIKDIHIAMLTTADSSGALYSRPMATQQTSFAGDLWFLTRRHSDKVEEIRHDAHVNLTYTDVKNSSFVSVSGRAEIGKDRAKIEELWNPMYKAWFPEGVNDPEIRVLQVRVHGAEYWDAPSSAVVRYFRILKRAATHGESKVGEHEKLTVNNDA